MSNTTVFDNSVPRRLQYSLTKSILENYRQSSRYCFQYFAAPQAKDLSGYFCRAKIEEDMAGIVALFPMASIDVQAYQNQTGFFNQITCGLVKLTQSRIVRPTDVPRGANFRTTLAENGQYKLFSSDPEAAGSQFLYAILTHVVDVNSEKRSWPAFVRIQFPNSNCTGYVDEGIDLLARFPDLHAEYLPNAAVLERLKRRRIRARAGA